MELVTDAEGILNLNPGFRQLFCFTAVLDVFNGCTVKMIFCTWFTES